MKKFLFILLLSSFSLKGFSQFTTSKEDVLLETIGSLSAGYIYNTYLGIGAIADGYHVNHYKADYVKQLMREQVSLADNLFKTLDKLVKNEAVEDDDLYYVNEVKEVLKGLKNQANLLINVCDNKNSTTILAFDEQRIKNWEKIQELLGIE